jgi:tRNA/rRNA methyltransferase
VSAPVIILVEPQLAENIGMAARAMANFGLSELRLVAPRDGWPRKGAHQAASGAGHILEAAALFADVRAAIADLGYVLATTARERGQMKRVFLPEAAMADVRARGEGAGRAGILFGRERTGLQNEEVSLADAIVTFPVEPGFASVNLAQAVLIVAYEWARASGRGAPIGGGGSPPARRESVFALFDYLEGALDAVGFYPEDKRPIMTRNMRDMFHRMAMSEQDVRTWRGALRALAEGRRPGKD